MRIKLEYTKELMNSSDYKERFIAEFWQTKIRYEKLSEMLVKYAAGTLEFLPSCDLEMLKEQKEHMENYLRILQIRAQIEEIDLTEEHLLQILHMHFCEKYNVLVEICPDKNCRIHQDKEIFIDSADHGLNDYADSSTNSATNKNTFINEMLEKINFKKDDNGINE